MATVTITLTQEAYKRFSAIAKAQGISIEDSIMHYVNDSGKYKFPTQEELSDVVDRVLEENEELFKRLA